MRIIVLSTINDWDLGQRLLDAGHEIIAWVVAKPEHPAKRRGPLLSAGVRLAKVLAARQRPTAPPPARFDQRAWLAERGLRPMPVADVNAAAFLDFVKDKQPDLLIVAMFPQILRQELLSLPGLVAVNYHPSPLPVYAGPQPTFWMLRNGEREAAVTVHWVTEKIDGGDILAQERVEIRPEDNNSLLIQRLHHRAAGVLAATVTALADGRAEARPQDRAQRRYDPRSQPEDRMIDWNSSAESICNLLRAVLPWQTLTAETGRWPLAIYAARPVDMPAEGAPGEILRKNGAFLTVQTGRGALEITGYELEHLHGWMNRLAQFAVPRTGQRLK